MKEIQIFCGRLDLKHLIDLSKMKIFEQCFYLLNSYFTVLYFPGFDISFC